MITTEQLTAIAPHAGSHAGQFVDPLNAALDRFRINVVARQAAFIANLAHESASFTRLEENLNYSWQALRRTWPSRFTTDEMAQTYHRDPEKIASFVYANRYGNRDASSGDGWRYRGRGLIQITFHDNYADCSTGLFSYPSKLLTEPELLLDPVYACTSAAWFWQSRGLNELADAGDLRAITKRINGGYNGYAERLAFYQKAQEVLT